MSTVTGPEAAGAIVEVYVAPSPVSSEAVPFPTTKSEFEVPEREHQRSSRCSPFLVPYLI